MRQARELRRLNDESVKGCLLYTSEYSHSRLSSRYLLTEFKTQAKEIKYATLQLCGLGMYELFMNGQRIGDQVLAPAPSDYRRTVLYNSFDVTKQVAGGNADNAIGVTLGLSLIHICCRRRKRKRIFPGRTANWWCPRRDAT